MGGLVALEQGAGRVFDGGVMVIVFGNTVRIFLAQVLPVSISNAYNGAMLVSR